MFCYRLSTTKWQVLLALHINYVTHSRGRGPHRGRGPTMIGLWKVGPPREGTIGLAKYAQGTLRTTYNYVTPNSSYYRYAILKFTGCYCHTKWFPPNYISQYSHHLLCLIVICIVVYHFVRKLYGRFICFDKYSRLKRMVHLSKQCVHLNNLIYV